jgi:hypothetical protein
MKWAILKDKISILPNIEGWRKSDEICRCYISNKWCLGIITTRLCSTDAPTDSTVEDDSAEYEDVSENNT